MAAGSIRNPETLNTLFRILSIDGGGIKGVFPAAFLTAIEECIAKPVADQFDLIAGTSTGGIIALSLGLGMKPKQLLEFYKEHGKVIFPSAQTLALRLKHYFRSKYRAAPLETSLRSAFGEKLLGHSQKRLLIPSFSALTGRIYIYKTPHHERFQSDWRVSAIDVALATAAAPTYFPPYISSNYISHLDGGMWANNPTGFAVVEAIGVLGAQPAEIRVLSLGCTSTAQTFTLRNAGMIGWRKKALDAAFNGQSFGAMGTAAVLIGHDNIQRVDPTVREGMFSLDDSSGIPELEGLARESAREALPRFNHLFGHGPAERFAPLYGPIG